MNYKIVAIQTFAILIVYIMFSLPFANATEINMIYGTTARNSNPPLNPDNLVSKSVTVSGDNVDVSVGGGNVEKVIVYKCKDDNPKDCIDSGNYESSSGGFSKTFLFSNISSNNIANIIIFAKTNNGGAAGWIGFWEEVVDVGLLYVVNRELDNINLYTKSFGSFDFIEDMIFRSQMIPFRSDMTERAHFTNVTNTYIAKGNSGDIDSGNFETLSSSSNELHSIDRDFFFVFPETTEGINDPITFYNAPDYHCGYGPGYDYAGSACESSLGESSSNCCLDCGCGSGYCDIGKGCQSVDLINLTVSGSMGITNCAVDNTINLNVIIANEPTNSTITSARYRLNQTMYSTQCTKSNPGYICPITVPALPDCDAGSFMIGNNRFFLNISFPDGNSTREESFEVPLDDVTITSWFPADGSCERELGENESNSCFDCGCISGFCDYMTPEEAECRADPVNSNVYVVEAGPVSFYKGTSSGTTVMNLNIRNSPKSLSQTSESCSSICTENGENSCIASCSISCSKLNSDSEHIYNETCTMNFAISNFNSSSVYELDSKLNLSIFYNNGANPPVSRTLQADGPSITIGLMNCGDGSCDSPWETKDNCCFDCGCNDGFFCDSNSPSTYTPGDSCKRESSMRLVAKDFNQTSFQDSSIDHYVNFESSIINPPSDIYYVDSDCNFESGTVCYVDCQQMTPQENFNCTLTVPGLNYNSSPLFNENDKKVHFNGNLSILFRYNNGSNRTSKTLLTPLPEITTTPKIGCGDNICDSRLGENADTCCIDCICQNDNKFGSGYFCFTGNDTNGQCVETDNMTMMISPPRVKCSVNLAGECITTSAVDVNVSIVNIPNNTRISSMTYMIGGKEGDTFCTVDTTSNTTLKLRCPITISDIPMSNPQSVKKSLSISSVIAFIQGGSTFTQNLSASTNLWIDGSASTEYINCQNAGNDIDDQKKKVDSQDKKLKIWLGVMGGITVVACGIGYLKKWPGISKGLCETAVIILSCGTAYYLHSYNKAEKELDDQKTEKMTLCAGDDYNSLRSSRSSSIGATDWSEMISWAACAMSVVWGLSGVVSSSKTPVSKPASVTNNFYYSIGGGGSAPAVPPRVVPALLRQRSA